MNIPPGVGVDVTDVKQAQSQSPDRSLVVPEPVGDQDSNTSYSGQNLLEDRLDILDRAGRTQSPAQGLA